MTRKRQRLTRPTPERTGPIRSWSSLLGGAAPPNAPPETEPAAPQAKTGGDGAGPGAVQRGVDLGYKVFEEYLRQGQAFARAISPSAAGAPGAALTDLPALTSRMFRYASDFASVWMEAMSTMVTQATSSSSSPFAPPPPFSSPSSSSSSSSSPSPSSRPRVELHLHSSRPADITVALDDGAADRLLAAADLRPRRGAARIGPVTVKRDARRGSVAFHVRVPPSAPKGTYTGKVVDRDTEDEVGVLTVKVRA
jgi:hypothetical protein